MPNILINPESGFLEFNTGSASGSAFDTSLSGAARLKFENSGELNLTSLGTGVADKFSIDGSNGRLLTVNNTVTGSIFSVNDVAGLPIVEVFSDDRVVMGQYATDALVVSGSGVSFANLPTISGQTFITGFAEGDTLQAVTDRGATTTNNIEIQGAGSKSFTVDSTDGHASVVIDRHSTSYDANLSFQTNGATKWRLWNNSNDSTFSIRDEVNASNVMTWEVGGNIGIGTDDPDGKLHIETAASSQTASTQADELIVENSTHGGISILTPDASRAHLYFNQGAFLRWQSSLFTIDTSNSAHHLALKAGGGNVGIGIANPSSPLDIKASLGADIPLLTLQNSSNGNGATIRFDDQSTNLQPANITYKHSDGSSQGGGASFHITGEADLTLVIGNSSRKGRMVVSSQGSASEADYGFYDDVNMGMSRMSADELGFITAGTERVRVDSAGNVGIGVTAPAVNLHVESSTSAQFKVGNGTQFVRLYADADEATILADGSVDMRFYVGGGEKMRLDTAGRLGIGSTSPQGKLDAGADTDQNIFLGRARFGSYVTDYLYLSHYDNATSTSYALKQSPAGSTAINAKASMNVSMSVNNSDIVFVQGSTSNVGIGTTNPARNLSVASSSTNALIQLANSTTTYAADNGLEIFISDTNAGIVNRENGYLRFDTSNTERVRIAAGGKVGIGTTNPAEKLNVHDGHIRMSDGYKIDWGGTNVRIDGDNSSDYFRVFTSSTERLRVASDGSVGIGSTNPVQKLDVAGVIRSSVTSRIQADVYNNSANSANIIYRQGTSTIVGNNTDALVVLDGGRVGIGSTSPGFKLEVVADETAGVMAVRNGTNGRDTFRSENAAGTRTFNIGNDAGGAGLALIRNSAGTVNTYLAGNGNSYFNAGSVGIGITDPSTSRLRIKGGTSDASTNALQCIDSSSAQLFYVRNDGVVGVDHNYFYVSASAGAYVQTDLRVRGSLSNDAGTLAIHGDVNFDSNTLYVDSSNNRVGIGVTSPSNTLDVAGGAEFNAETYIRAQSNVGLRIQTIDQGLTTNDGLRIGLNGTHAFVWNLENKPLALATNNQERVTILEDGNVGIGVTSPTEKLHVEGKLRLGTTPVINSHDTITIDIDSNNNQSTNYFRVTKDGEATELMRVQENGNVGIGTNDPDVPLEVTMKSTELMNLGSSGPNATLQFAAGSSTIFGGIGARQTNTSQSALGLLASTTNASTATYGDMFFSTRENDSSDFSTTAGKKAFSFVRYTSALMTIMRDGNVGIGTNAPAFTNGGGLEIESTTATLRLQKIGGNAAELNMGASSFDIRDLSAGHINYYVANTIKWKMNANGLHSQDIANGISFYGDSNLDHAIVSRNTLGSVADDIRINSYGAVYINLDSNSNNTVGADFAIGRHGGSVGTMADTSFFYLNGENGKVGIGTNVPGALLDIRGDMRLDSAGNTDRSIYFRNQSSVGKVRSDASLQFDVGVASSPSAAMYIAEDTRNVGIGTTTPPASAKVSIQANNTNEIHTGLCISSYQSTAGTAGNGVGIVMGQDNGVYSSKIANVWTNNNPSYLQTNIAFYTMHDSYARGSETEKMRLTSDGRLGIGVTNPSQRLEVVTNTDGSAQIGRAHIGYVGFADHAGFAHLDNASTSNYSLLQSSAGDTFINSAASRHIYFRDGNATIGGFNSDDDFYVDTDTLYVDSSNGRVGVGLTNPVAKLEIKTATLSNGILVKEDTDGSNVFNFWIDGSDNGRLWLYPNGGTHNIELNTAGYSYFNGGNVGIGTTSPDMLLTVEGKLRSVSNMTLGSDETYGGTYGAIGIGTTSLTNGQHRIFAKSSDHMYFAAATSKGFRFRANGGATDHVSIPSNGNLGIGITNPANKLDVAGGVAIGASYVGNSAPSNGAIIQGNVGIGTSSVSYALQVNGSIVGSYKSFLIDHPTKEGKQLMHSCIEGPEHAVYFRGKSNLNVIKMPDYWEGLVDLNTMTVELTAIGANQNIYVDSIAENGEVTVGSNTDEPLNYFYVVYGERKDIDKLEIEIVKPQYAD